MSPSDAARLVSAIEQLTLQVSRVAYAVEEQSIANFRPRECDTCRRCGCNLVPVDTDKCPVCKEPYEWKEHDDGNPGVEAERP